MPNMSTLVAALLVVQEMSAGAVMNVQAVEFSVPERSNFPEKASEKSMGRGALKSMLYRGIEEVSIPGMEPAGKE